MLRVLMVCLRPLVAAGVRSALQAVNDLQLLDEICESHNVLQQCHQLAPDVLLIQSSQFENSFYELTSQLHSLCPTTNILLLLEPDEDCTIDLQRFVQTGGVAQYYLMNQLQC